MIGSASKLEEVCFHVATALESCGVEAVLTGGSAATVYSAGAYTSLDADFVLTRPSTTNALTTALAKLGFVPSKTPGMFEHPEIRFTVDFLKGPLAVGGDYVRETATLERNGLRLRILTTTDCVRDRLAHFYFWSDYTALRAAAAVARAQRRTIDLANLREWTRRESVSPGPDFTAKFEEFLRRVGVER